MRGVVANPPMRGTRLLERDGGASLFELSLGLLGGLLVRALEHDTGGAVKASLFGAAYMFNAPLAQAARAVDALRQKQESGN